jgi:hypothetical protein
MNPDPWAKIGALTSVEALAMANTSGFSDVQVDGLFMVNISPGVVWRAFYISRATFKQGCYYCSKMEYIVERVQFSSKMEYGQL